jgi:hypothetical protein
MISSVELAIDDWDLIIMKGYFEAIRILLALATSKGFKLYQMNVKNAFLNGVIQDEVYVR